MKRVLAIAITALSLIATGCTKSKSDQPTQDIPVRNPKSLLRDGGDDEDRPIVIHRVENISGVAVANASIGYTNADTTVSGLTNSLGNCTVALPHTGDWDFVITHLGYLPKYGQVTVSSDTTTRTDILYTE